MEWLLLSPWGFCLIPLLGKLCSKFWKLPHSVASLPPPNLERWGGGRRVVLGVKIWRVGVGRDRPLVTARGTTGVYRVDPAGARAYDL